MIEQNFFQKYEVRLEVGNVVMIIDYLNRLKKKLLF